MAYVVKERSQYTQKDQLSGNERIIVNGYEYVTPDQILGRAGIQVGEMVVYVDSVQALRNKTYEGYTLGAACARGVAASSSSGSTTLVPLSLLKSYAQTKITTSSKLDASLVSGLATVATSGKYSDLTGLPAIPEVAAIDATSFEIDGIVYDVSGSGGNYLPLTGGQLTGDLWLKRESSNYGNTIFFGNKASDGTGYVYLTEATNNVLTIYASAGIKLKATSSSNITLNDNRIVTVADKATTSAYGVVKIAAARASSVTVATGYSAADRFYGVEMDSNGKLFVNVPWVAGGNAMTANDLFNLIGGSAPILARKRGSYRTRTNDVIEIKHKAQQNLVWTSYDFVLMVAAKRNRRSPRSQPNEDGYARTKKGWCVAMGGTAEQEFLERSSFDVTELREYILKTYMFVEGYTKAQLQNMSYDTFHNLPSNLRKGFGTNLYSIRATKTFGIALRVVNPEFEAAKSDGHSHGIHCQSINGHPRYIYSDVAKMYVYVDSAKCSINFGFIR